MVVFASSSLARGRRHPGNSRRAWGLGQTAFLRSGAVLARGIARSVSCSMGMFEWESPFFTRLRSNGEFVFERPRPNRELAAEGFDGVASESLDGAARGRGASS